MARVIVESDHEDTGVVTADRHDEIVQGGEVLVVASQKRSVLTNSPEHNARRAQRQSPKGTILFSDGGCAVWERSHPREVAK